MLHTELAVVQATLPQPRASEVLVDSLDVQVAAHGMAYMHMHRHMHMHALHLRMHMPTRTPMHMACVSVCHAARHGVACGTALERAPMAGGGAA